MASGLSARVTAIESAVALLSHFADRLGYLQPTMGGLVETACAAPTLGSLAYLTGCRDAMRGGMPFPPAWREAVKRRPGALGQEEQALLLALADTLGVTDLGSQLTTLAFTRERMEHRLAQARADREKYQRLYGTLGVLAGLAAAIILV